MACTGKLEVSGDQIPWNEIQSSQNCANNRSFQNFLGFKNLSSGGEEG